MSQDLLVKTGVVLILLIHLAIIGCSQNDPGAQIPNKPPSITSNTGPSVPSTAARCKTIGKVAGETNSVIVCSSAPGKSFNPGAVLKLSTSDAVMYKEMGKERVVVRDLADWMPQISSLDFAFEFEVNQEKELTAVKIWFPSEDYPKWEAKPLFVERIDLRTGHAVVQPQEKIPTPRDLDVARRFAEINVPREQIEVAAQKRSVEPLDFLYSSLFAIRDYGFYDPVQSMKYLESLNSWNWNDGEVAEVVAVLKVEVDYLKGKTVEMPKAR